MVSPPYKSILSSFPIILIIGNECIKNYLIIIIIY